MNEVPRILLVEDQEVDAILIQRELRRQGLTFTTRRVDREDDMIRALGEFTPDLVISDFTLPGFSGLEALAILRKERPGVPLIFVSGTVVEEAAVEWLKLGVADCVSKDDLARLPASVDRALRESQSTRGRPEAAENMTRARCAEEVGSLSAGMAHDLNNLLAPISMAVSMLRGKPADAERERLLTIIENSTRRASEIVRESLAAGRRLKTAARRELGAAVAASAGNGRRDGIGGGCILLVDDEETIRFAVKAVLSKQGYRVLTATDGAEALKVFNAQADEITLVLTDLMMPVMGGLALVRAVWQVRPGLPVIMSSGQDEKTRQAELAAAGIHHVLNKPYAADILLRTVAEALGRRVRIGADQDLSGETTRIF